MTVIPKLSPQEQFEVDARIDRLALEVRHAVDRILGEGEAGDGLEIIARFMSQLVLDFSRGNESEARELLKELLTLTASWLTVDAKPL